MHREILYKWVVFDKMCKYNVLSGLLRTRGAFSRSFACKCAFRQLSSLACLCPTDILFGNSHRECRTAPKSVRATPACGGTGAARGFDGKEADSMGSIDTMTLLGNSFISLAEHLPIEKISVSDIVAASSKNRKTFYYHFEGKESLIRWIFRRDLGAVLTERIEPEELVYEKSGVQTLLPYPYYICKKVGVRSLDGSEFAFALAACFQNRRSYYAKVLRLSGPDSLGAYLRALYIPAFESDIRFILSNRYLAEGNVRFLAEFYVGALLSYLFEKVCDPTCADLMANVKPFQNIIHSSLESEIKKQQLKRVL